MMSSPQALAAQLRNMSIKNRKWAGLSDEVENLISNFGNPSKLQGLLNIIAKLKTEKPADWRIVVFTTRKETQKMIVSILDKQGVSFGVIRGGAPDANFKCVKDYTATPPLINVIISTDAGAEGINLQAGNVVVNYDLPWNPMILEQRIGRVQRLASQHAYVVILNLAVQDSPEEKVVSRLMEKLLTVSHTVGDVESILEASGGDNDNGSSSFEITIRELVIKSLKGQNVKRATQLEIQSIEDAKELFEEHRNDLDSKLGDLSDLHDSGPSMPRLESITPSMPYQEFVKKALEVEGFELSTDMYGNLTASKNGVPTEQIVFTNKEWQKHSQPGRFHGRSPRLYVPGKPDFERLVQRWLDRGQHLTRDLTVSTEVLAEKLAASWVAKIEDARFDSISTLASHQFWQGSTKLKITVTNSVDSYETLGVVNHLPDNHDEVIEHNILSSSLVNKIRKADIDLPSLGNSGKEACSENPGVVGFCDFYKGRIKEEIHKSVVSGLTKKIHEDLNPSVHAETVSQNGYLYEVCDIEVHYSFEENSDYSSKISVCPATNQVLSEPEIDGKCEESERTVPSGCLGKCVRSGKHVLKHLLITSDESGRQALSRFSHVCELTGMIILDDEQLVSVVSGKSGILSSFHLSPISNRPALPFEFITCSFTGDAVLPDEINSSEISHKPFRSDQTRCSIISGLSGHESEFVKCEVTGDYLLASEATVSAVSGVYVREDQSVTSEIPPFRIGIVHELAMCGYSGKRLLADEVKMCSVTNQLVDETLLGKSDFSQQLALRSEMVRCEVTDDLLLPNETATSAVSLRQARLDFLIPSDISGKLALPDECRKCEITNSIALPDELMISELSGKGFRTDQLIISDVSGRVAHQSESVTCAYSEKRLLVDETGTSEVSGMIVDKELLIPSDISGKLALSDEMEQCQFTGKKGIPDEFTLSDVSEKRLSADEKVTSEITERVGHSSESVECQHSNKIVLDDEIVKSVVSGLIISTHFAAQSPVSHEWALKSEFTDCEITGDAVLESDLVTSDESGRRFRKDESIKSSETDQIYHISECFFCELKESLVPFCETAFSDVSGKRVAASLLVVSEKSGRKGTSDESLLCEETSKRLLIDELSPSAVSGDLVDKDLLEPSTKSGRLAVSRELITCSITQQRLLPTEVDFCEDIQAFADCELTGKSSVSGKNVLRDNLIKCSLTNNTGLESELVQCDLTGKYVIPEMSATCVVTEKTICVPELVRSDLSGRYMLPSESRKSFTYNQILCPDEAEYCHWNKGFLTRPEIGICARTGLTFSLQGLTSTTRELVVFSKLNKHKRLESLDDLVPWVQQQMEGKLKSVVSLHGIRNSKGNCCAVRATIRKMLGMVSKSAFFMINLSPQPEIIGKITINSDQPPGWHEL
ncbi:MAG: hypothetical protein JKY95_04745 [Planctomycetaceae bacterium]|nr:hypothetical protein [Planctomycetaceae bacterium]